jgi:hypothetical protein
MVHRHREYILTVRQEPKQARMCGVGGKGEHPFPFFSPFHELLIGERRRSG